MEVDILLRELAVTVGIDLEKIIAQIFEILIQRLFGLHTGQQELRSRCNGGGGRRLRRCLL